MRIAVPTRNDSDWRATCQARLLFLSAAPVAGLVGCAYTPATTVKVRDPAQVQVAVTTDDGMKTILPAGADAVDVALPDASPPFSAGYRDATILRRYEGGPVDVVCEKCSPANKTLVPVNRTIRFAPQFNVASFDWTRSEMRMHIKDTRDGEFGTRSSFEAEVVTPWTNVEEVRRVSAPDRYLGAKLILSSLVGFALGGFALGDGLSRNHPATTAFSAVILPISVALAAGGAWYFFAPEREQILFGGKGEAPVGNHESE
jgi:hypothetical protein